MNFSALAFLLFVVTLDLKTAPPWVVKLLKLAIYGCLVAALFH